MKKSIVLFCFFLLIAISHNYAQLKIDTAFRLDPNPDSVVAFMKHNQFNYGILYWNISNWMSDRDEFQGLVQQDDKWYVVKITSNLYLSHKLRNFGKLLSTVLTEKQANKLLKKLNVKSTFLYNQTDYDNLRGKCGYSIMDAGTWNLVEKDNIKARALYYDAPEFYIKNCYPKVADYKILKPFINTCKQLNKAVKTYNQ